MDLKILLLIFLLVTSCVSKINKGAGLEQEIAFNIVKNSPIFKEFELKCDSISPNSCSECKKETTLLLGACNLKCSEG